MKHLAGQQTRRLNPRSNSGFLTVETNVPGELQVLHYKQPHNCEMLDRESAELKRAARATESVAGICPLRVEDRIQEQGLLLTEPVESAESLFNSLWNSSRFWGLSTFTTVAPAAIGRRLGEWLSVYHHSSLAEETSLQGDENFLVKTALGKLAVLSRCKSSCAPASLLTRVRSFFEKLADRHDVWSLQDYAQIHGDFSLSNLLIAPDGIIFVTDFGDTRRGYVVEDLARCWHELWCLTQTTGKRRRLLQPCLDEFLTAYGCDREILDDPVFDAARQWNAITQILMAVELRNKLPYLSARRVLRLARVCIAWLERRHSR